jgi:hypothetical protein
MIFFHMLTLAPVQKDGFLNWTATAHNIYDFPAIVIYFLLFEFSSIPILIPHFILFDTLHLSLQFISYLTLF